MKKIIIALVLITFMLANTAFAGEKEISERVQKAFEKEFAGAVDVQWSIYDDYIKVDFSLKDMRLIACYNNEGETLAVVRNIHSSLLPLLLQFDLKKIYKNYWITDLFELADSGGTHYYLTLENADGTVQLHSNGNNEWEFVRKERKK